MWQISGITKGFTSAAGTPALKLIFQIRGMPQEGNIEDSDEFLAIGKHELGPPKNVFTEYM